MRFAGAATAATLALGIAACGSGDDKHSFADLRSCLTKAADGTSFVASTDGDDMDYLAEEAGDGAIVLSSDKQEITVVVERSRADAGQTADAYEAFDAPSENVDIAGNTVVVYSKSPTDDESAAVDACLEGEVVKLPGSVADAPVDDDPAIDPVADVEGDEEPVQTNLALGEGGKDDGLGFKVIRLDEVASIEPLDEYSSAVYPPPGGKLIAAEVEMTNYGKTSMDPFCGGGGAVLLDIDDRNYEVDSEAMLDMGGEICLDGIAPGFNQTVTLPFKVPAGFKMGGLILWNPDSSDPDGEESELFISP